jgi:hypothetical protein
MASRAGEGLILGLTFSAARARGRAVVGGIGGIRGTANIEVPPRFLPEMRGELDQAAEELRESLLAPEESPRRRELSARSNERLALVTGMERAGGVMFPRAQEALRAYEEAGRQEWTAMRAQERVPADLEAAQLRRAWYQDQYRVLARNRATAIAIVPAFEGQLSCLRTKLREPVNSIEYNLAQEVMEEYQLQLAQQRQWGRRLYQDRQVARAADRRISNEMWGPQAELGSLRWNLAEFARRDLFTEWPDLLRDRP